MPRKESMTGQISAQAQQDQVSEGIENFELPRSLVTRIAKSAIPENAKLQKETVLSLVKGTTVFINYLAATAHDVAHSKQHKSISASDVLRALEIIEFGDMIELCQAELQIYRENAKADKSRKSSAGASITASAKSASASAAKKGKAPASASASAPVKGKAREQEHAPPVGAGALSSPFTRAPHPLSSVSLPGDADVDEDEQMADVEGEETEGAEGVEEYPEEDEGENGDLAEEIGEEEMELVDSVDATALEEETGLDEWKLDEPRSQDGVPDP